MTLGITLLGILTLISLGVMIGAFVMASAGVRGALACALFALIHIGAFKWSTGFLIGSILLWALFLTSNRLYQIDNAKVPSAPAATETTTTSTGTAP